MSVRNYQKVRRSQNFNVQPVQLVYCKLKLLPIQTSMTLLDFLVLIRIGKKNLNAEFEICCC